MSWIEQADPHLILNIRVIPRASKDAIQGFLGDVLKIRIKAPPIDEKANLRLIKFLSKTWKIPRSSLTILSGKTGRNKRLKISNPSPELRKELLSFDNR